MRNAPPRVPALSILGLGLSTVILGAGTFGPGPNDATLPSTGQDLSILIATPADGEIVEIPDAGPAAAPIPVTGQVSIGSVAGDPINVLSIIDTSCSTGFSSTRGQDCNGDGSLDAGDDLNHDGVFGDTLDCEISGVLALNQSLYGFVNLEVGLIEFNSFARALDMNPHTSFPDVELFTSPAELDLDGDGVPDLEQAASGLLSGGGTNFNDALDEMNATFATQPAGQTNVAFFLSDGQGFLDQSPASPLQQAVDAGTVVNTFSVGTGATGCDTFDELFIIADRTGGTCTEVLDPSELASVLPGVTPALLDRVEVNGTVVATDALGNFALDAFCPEDGGEFDITATAFASDPDSTQVSADVTVFCQAACPFLTDPGDLGVAGAYNVFVFDDYTGGLDVEGAVAVGDDVTFSDFRVGYGLTGGPAIVAGGDVTLADGEVGGSAVYGGSGAATNTTFLNGGALTAGAPVDFTAAQDDLEQLSGNLALLYPSHVTQIDVSGALTLAGDDPYVNVFDVMGTDLEAASSLTVDAPAGSTVVINVSGADLDVGSFQWTNLGVTSNTVLMNAFEATRLDLGSIGVRGSVLAPFADVSFSSSDIEGTLVAYSLTGDAEFYDHAFTGSIDDCPEEPTSAVQSCHLDYDIVNAWPNGTGGMGYQVQVTFSHTGSPINDWDLSWTFPGVDSVQNGWNGQWSQAGSDVAIDAYDWNASVTDGQNVSLGFIGNTSHAYPTLPQDVQLNGVDCD